MERFHLRVELSESVGVGENELLYVHERTNQERWGVVKVVEFGEEHSVICIPIDRSNPEFWEHLENRMKFDTGAPSNVYLVRLRPSDFQRAIENFLSDWG